MKILMTILVLLSACTTAWGHQIELDAISIIESTNNPHAVSYAGSKYGRGLFQISEICLKHYNEVHKTKHKPDDLFDPKLNRVIADWYFGWLSERPDVKSYTDCLIAYNWGLRKLREFKSGRFPLPDETVGYIKFYNELTDYNKRKILSFVDIGK